MSPIKFTRSVNKTAEEDECIVTVVSCQIIKESGKAQSEAALCFVIVCGVNMKKLNTDSNSFKQLSIYEAISNLKTLSQKQKMKENHLYSQIVEVQNADSETTPNCKKSTIKRRLPFSLLSDNEDSGTELCEESDERK